MRPTSSSFRTYVWFVAPEMFEQLLPLEWQRCQWYENVIGVEPDHVPLEAVSVCPSLAVPEIVGRDVFAGADERAPIAAPAERNTTAAASTATYLHMAA